MNPSPLTCGFNQQQVLGYNEAAKHATANWNRSSRHQDNSSGRSGPISESDRQKSESRFSRLTLINLICFSVIFCLLIQSCAGKEVRHESPENKPCICNSTFYQLCPPSSECQENYSPDDRNGRPTRPDYGDLGDYPIDSEDRFHDDYDPDHVSDPYDLDPFYGPRLNPGGPYDSDPFYESSAGNLAYDNVVSSDRVVTRRKVYVAPKPKNDVPIHTVKIRVPLKLPEAVEPQLPPPKPLFKLKKYTTYESKPEIHMVPVTKTIIRPVGVSPDQIIDETGEVKKLR